MCPTGKREGLMTGDEYEDRARRLWQLKPVWVIYAVLLGLVGVGMVLETVSEHAHLLWFIFFLAPFTLLYCIPFGLGVGILVQRLVWYTQDYGHRFVALGTALVAVAMLLAWGPAVVRHKDIIYVLAILWPIVASGLAMLIGMYFIRADEYEESVRFYEEHPDLFEGVEAAADERANDADINTVPSSDMSALAADELAADAAKSDKSIGTKAEGDAPDDTTLYDDAAPGDVAEDDAATDDVAPGYVAEDDAVADDVAIPSAEPSTTEAEGSRAASLPQENPSSSEEPVRDHDDDLNDGEDQGYKAGLDGEEDLGHDEALNSTDAMASDQESEDETGPLEYPDFLKSFVGTARHIRLSADVPPDDTVAISSGKHQQTSKDSMQDE